MGLGTIGLAKTIFKRKFRWMLEIPSIVGDGINMYPPTTAARPKLTFNDFQVNHLVEIITIPGRPVWNPITITVYDIPLGDYGQNKGKHPIYEWILSLYGRKSNDFSYYPSGKVSSREKRYNQATRGFGAIAQFKLPQAYITMYDGCGTKLEQWTLESVWPSEIDFGELDMGSSEVSLITMTLKYDRAYLEVF
jgi:hypothetical protein